MYGNSWETFPINISQRWVNISYMDPMGYMHDIIMIYMPFLFQKNMFVKNICRFDPFHFTKNRVFLFGSEACDQYGATLA